MAAVLYVQGLELDVSAAEWEPVRLGGVARGFSGQPRSTVRATKRDHHFVGDAQGMPVATAELLRALVEGEGHSWSFDDNSSPEALLASSRGLLPSSTGAVSDVPGKYGGAVEFDDGEPATRWELALDSTDCTIMYWVNEGGTWVHYLLLYSGAVSPSAVWRDAVRTDADPEYLYFESADGTMVADPSVMGTFQLDDLVVLPYVVPDAWVSAFHTWRSTAQWNPLPYVAAAGAAFPRGTVKVLGQMGTAHRVPLWEGGSFTMGEQLDFTLQES